MEILIQRGATEMIRHAMAVLYISHVLARRYPANLGTYATVVSDVRLDEEVYTEPRNFRRRLSRFGLSMSVLWNNHIRDKIICLKQSSFVR